MKEREKDVVLEIHGKRRSEWFVFVSAEAVDANEKAVS
jgi:hypothetical protein